MDGYTLNPGDLDWEELKKLGELIVYDRTPYEQTLERCANADAILTNKAPLGKDVLEKLPSLKYIGVIATGYNIIDVDSC